MSRGLGYTANLGGQLPQKEKVMSSKPKAGEKVTVRGETYVAQPGGELKPESKSCGGLGEAIATVVGTPGRVASAILPK